MAQQSADPRVQAALDRASDLYQARGRLMCLLDRLEIGDLEHLWSILVRLSDLDLRAVARYAEALADWPSPEPPSRSARGEDPP